MRNQANLKRTLSI